MIFLTLNDGRTENSDLIHRWGLSFIIENGTLMIYLGKSTNSTIEGSIDIKDKENWRAQLLTVNVVRSTRTRSWRGSYYKKSELMIEVIPRDRKSRKQTNQKPSFMVRIKKKRFRRWFI